MSSIQIQFNTDNDAFHEEERNIEAARILRKLADDMERGAQDESTTIRDLNGNTIGTIEIYTD